MEIGVIVVVAVASVLVLAIIIPLAVYAGNRIGKASVRKATVASPLDPTWNGLALWAIATGLLSVVLYPFAGFFAIGFGIAAFVQMRVREGAGEPQKGGWIAAIGMAIGFIGLGAGLVRYYS